MLKPSSSLVIVIRPTRLQGLRAAGEPPGRRNLYWSGHTRSRPTGEWLLADQGANGARSRTPMLTSRNTTRKTWSTSAASSGCGASLDFGLPIKVLDRSFVPTYDFWTTRAVVVVGQDGLVANTAKYVGDLPIIAVNPDPRDLTAFCCHSVSSRLVARWGVCLMRSIGSKPSLSLRQH